MPNRAVSDKTMYAARSLAEIPGSEHSEDWRAMDDIIVMIPIGNAMSMHVAALARETVTDCRTEHIGYRGNFLFASNEIPGEAGINVLGKVASYDAALQLIDLLGLAER